MFVISAEVTNGGGDHQITLTTNDRQHSITIPPKLSGKGSSASGAEVLFLALATCYCNDIYREARYRNIVVRHVTVEVVGMFDGAPGHTAQDVTYQVIVEAEASEAEIKALIEHTDTVAEIHNTLREATPITLVDFVAVSV